MSATDADAEFEIAVAGIGAVAEMHALAIGDIENATLAAGSCRTAEKGQEFADEFDCEWYQDTEEMLDEVDPDVLNIATPSGAHLDPTLAAAERGIHVLCEKPLEITTDRIDEQVAACEEAGVRLGGIFPQRYNDVVRTVHDAASEERFGGVSVVNTYVPWWREDEYYENAWQGTRDLDGGGALMNQSIHGVDAIQWLAGANQDLAREENPVEEVFAYTDTLAHEGDAIEVEDTAVAVLKYRNGALGQILGATSMYPGSLKRIQMAGRDGTAEILEEELITWEFREERDDDGEIRERFTETETGGGAADPMDIDYSLHTANIRDYLASLADDEPYMLDGAEARKAIEIIESVYESAEAGRPVDLG
jgi:predicted dehydrogenase